MSRAAGKRLMTGAAALSAAGFIAGCGGGTGPRVSNERAAQLAHQIISGNLKPEDGVALEDVSCVSDGDLQWSCVAKMRDDAGATRSYGVALTCDATGACITKPE